MTVRELAKIAHLSDLHLETRGGLPFPHWRAKRVLGYLNWSQRRKRSFSGASLDRLIADLKSQDPDHVAVTGDLINFGLPSEYIAAAQWLERLGPPAWISVVPGNHDIYVSLRKDRGIGRWAPYMAADAYGRSVAAAVQGAETFPYVRRIAHEVAIVGLNSAIPTPLFVAAGALGARQVAAAERLLRVLGEEGLTRVVLIHHPPLPGQASRRRALRDAGNMAAMLRRAGADLVLHGHNHTNSLAWAEGPRSRIPIVGIAAGGLGEPLHPQEDLGRYNMVRILEHADGRRTLQVEGRGPKMPGGPIEQLDLQSFDTVPTGEQAATGD